jgi:hypothetical protein
MSNISQLRKELPSVWESWTDPDMEKLKLKELIHLHANLKRKTELVSDHIERYIYFDDDEKYLKIFQKHSKNNNNGSV